MGDFMTMRNMPHQYRYSYTDPHAQYNTNRIGQQVENGIRKFQRAWYRKPRGTYVKMDPVKGRRAYRHTGFSSRDFHYAEAEAAEMRLKRMNDALKAGEVADSDQLREYREHDENIGMAYHDKYYGHRAGRREVILPEDFEVEMTPKMAEDIVDAVGSGKYAVTASDAADPVFMDKLGQVIDMASNAGDMLENAATIGKAVTYAANSLGGYVFNRPSAHP
jgi:hypothetical protein